MLAASVLGSHVHADALRPDRIIATGVIEPYPVRSFNPTELARRILQPFTQMGSPGPLGAVVDVPSEPPPEALVEMARNFAIAIRQGIKPPNWLPRQIYQMISAMLRGVAFDVTSQGRTLTVSPTQDRTTYQLSGGGGPSGLTINPVQSAAMVGNRQGEGPMNYYSSLPGVRQATDRMAYLPGAVLV